MRPDDAVSKEVIAACMEVHRALGPGLLESVYEECLCYELRLRGLGFARQVSLPLIYKEVFLESVYRLDLIVEHALVVELKAVDCLSAVHVAQLRTYLKLINCRAGLLVNFNVAILRHGLRRVEPTTI
jgi:GxxExxY protein